MRDKKIITLIVLSIAAVVSLLYGITSSSRPRQSTAVISSGTAISASSTPIDVRVVKRRAARTKFKSWKRSPFIAPRAQGASTLVLNGIIGGKAPKAMIGDMLVGVGDKIGSNTVIAIKKDRVILNDGDKDFELALKQ